jgi:ABC-type polar amino acid transport system ATPase subunit
MRRMVDHTPLLAQARKPMTVARPLLNVRALRKAFGQLSVLNGIDFDVSAGQVVFIIGSSGSGKSTFLRCLNFLETPRSGSIVFDRTVLCSGSADNFHVLADRELRKYRAQMPMVFQQFNLFSHMNVIHNLIEGPVTVLHRSRVEATEQAVQVLERVQLRDKQHAYPGELSGGQQQRVAIARALMMNPRAILFDEPTSSLDPELVADVLDTIRLLAADGMTMIIVTHEMAFARNLADRVHFMADGRIAESGTPDEIFKNPANPQLRSFIASMLS